MAGVKAEEGIYDLAVIGGGINGCGIARDAAGRGLRRPAASRAISPARTSSASTKLIHGGLRYLEHYEFRLVREALIEREVLLRAAPHIIWPLRFVLPHHARPAARPGCCGSACSSTIISAAAKLPAADADARSPRDPPGEPLKPAYSRAASNIRTAGSTMRAWSCSTRVDAAERGAAIRTRTRCIVAPARGRRLAARTATRRRDGVRTIAARGLVNAAGPWVDEVLGRVARRQPPAAVRLVKGSHIVVPQTLRARPLPTSSRTPTAAIVFAIPYERDFTLIGTTDEDYRRRSRDLATSATAEIDYLCGAGQRVLQRAGRRSRACRLDLFRRAAALR